MKCVLGGKATRRVATVRAIRRAGEVLHAVEIAEALGLPASAIERLRTDAAFWHLVAKGLSEEASVGLDLTA